LLSIVGLAGGDFCGSRPCAWVTSKITSKITGEAKLFDVISDPSTINYQPSTFPFRLIA
jgi:hypothetical protein